MRFLLILAAVAVAAFLFWRWRQQGDSDEGYEIRNFRSEGATPGDEPQTVLRPGPNACSIARQQAGRSFGSAEMPRLPLPGCRAASCDCRFETVQGRRRRQRRESDDRRATVRFDEKGGERRQRDRRKTGGDPWGIDPEADREE